MSTRAGEPLLARAPRIVWRLGPEHVLLQRLGGEQLELIGAAAMVWVALDVARSRPALIEELAELDVRATDVEATIAALLAQGIVVEA